MHLIAYNLKNVNGSIMNVLLYNVHKYFYKLYVLHKVNVRGFQANVLILKVNVLNYLEQINNVNFHRNLVLVHIIMSVVLQCRIVIFIMLNKHAKVL